MIECVCVYMGPWALPLGVRAMVAAGVWYVRKNTSPAMVRIWPVIAYS